MNMFIYSRKPATQSSRKKDERKDFLITIVCF